MGKELECDRLQRKIGAIANIKDAIQGYLYVQEKHQIDDFLIHK